MKDEKYIALKVAELCHMTAVMGFVLLALIAFAYGQIGFFLALIAASFYAIEKLHQIREERIHQFQPKWTLAVGATDEETAAMETWPEKWWEDKEWCKAELVKYPKCVLVDEYGETCNDIDPEGPGSCHCPRCNLVAVMALTEYATMTKQAIDRIIRAKQ